MAVSVKIDDELKRRIQGVADSQQRSAHSIMHDAIREYVERAEAHGRFVQEALASWRHYKQTGLHLTLDEVDAWLETWGTSEEKGPPECHT